MRWSTGSRPSPTTSRNISSSDLLFYRAGHPEALVAREAAHWDPVLFWAADTLGAHFILAEGIVHVRQPDHAIAAARAALPADPWSIAALHVVTTLTGSALLALALLRGVLDPDQVWAAAHVDEDWNIEKWGVDEEVAARRAARLVDFRAAARILKALNPARAVNERFTTLGLAFAAQRGRHDADLRQSDPSGDRRPGRGARSSCCSRARVIDAQVLKILADNLVRIAIAGLSIDVLSRNSACRPARPCSLRYRRRQDGIRLAVVGPGRAALRPAQPPTPSRWRPNALRRCRGRMPPAIAAAPPKNHLDAAGAGWRSSAAAQTAATQQGSLAPLFANLGVVAGVGQPAAEAAAGGRRRCWRSGPASIRI